jgi:ketosteroid isomerase-like protein
MRYVLAVAVVFLSCLATASAQPPDPAITAPVFKFVDAFNKGDLAAAAATHAAGADLAIIDEVPPFIWRGPNAFQAWTAALDADAKQKGMVDPKVTLGQVTRVETSGEDAYVVVPCTFTFTQKGVAMRARAQIAAVLKKGPTGWLIQSWAWTGPRPEKAGTGTK